MLAFSPQKKKVLDAIAVLIGKWLHDAPMFGVNKQLELAETIAITEMPPHSTNASRTGPIFHGHWFHQLKSGRKYVGYAISTPIGPTETDWMIEAVYKANLSNQIAVVVRWIEENVQGDGIVRMLAEPRHHLHALTITNHDGVRVVLAHIPWHIEGLRKRVIYSWADFVAQLSKTKPVRGVQVGVSRRAVRASVATRRQRRVSPSHSKGD